jgi:uncharacterized protein YbjT (DUF2867 family)
MILVTGATGTIGSEVLAQLTDLGERVRAMTRDPAKLAGTSRAEVVQGDFGDPDSLAKALAGVEAVFLVTVATPPSALDDLALLSAAGQAGVRRVVKLSAIGTGEAFDGQLVGSWHLAAEQAIQASGLEWTILRPSSFASNTLRWASAIEAGQFVPNPTGEAAQGVIDPRDVAAVGVQALTRPEHDGRIYTLTGPELLSVPQQTAILAGILGHPVTADPVDHLTLEQLMAFGTDRRSAEAILLGVRWAGAGHNAVLTDEVARILGRAPGSFAEWARQAFPTGVRTA